MAPEDVCIEIAAAQHGLLSRGQARERGVSASALSRLASSPRWAAPQPHVLQHAAAPSSWEARMLAPVLASEAFVLSHRTAARVHGFRAFEDFDLIEGSMVGRRDLALRDVVLHHPRDLAPTDIGKKGPLRLTARLRTLIDLGACHQPHDYIALVDDVLAQHDIAVAAVHARASALQHGRRNAALLARLTAPDAADSFRSWLERRTATVFARAGIPPCQWNLRIETRSGRLLGIVDCCWVRARLVVELDGLRFHSSAGQRRADQARQNGLTIEGYRVLRFTWRDVMEQPERVVREVTAALRQAG